MNRVGIMHPHDAVASCCNLPLSLSLIKLFSFPFSKDTLLKLARNRRSAVNFFFLGKVNLVGMEVSSFKNHHRYYNYKKKL